MIRWYDSVRLDRLHPAMVLALWRAEQIYAEEAGAGDPTVWVTSGNDRTHKVGSKHYDGRAVDLRTHGLPDEATRQRVADRLGRALGPQFTVLYEDAGKANAHIHLQFNGQ